MWLLESRSVIRSWGSGRGSIIESLKQPTRVNFVGQTARNEKLLISLKYSTSKNPSVVLVLVLLNCHLHKCLWFGHWSAIYSFRFNWPVMIKSKKYESTRRERECATCHPASYISRTLFGHSPLTLKNSRQNDARKLSKTNENFVRTATVWRTTLWSQKLLYFIFRYLVCLNVRPAQNIRQLFSYSSKQAISFM